MKIEPYLFVKSATQPVYHPSGRKITFLSNSTGVPQVWEYEPTHQWPYQVSFTKERVMFVRYISGTSTKIIGMDEGVNEKQQLYILQDNGDLIPLTNAPDFIHRYGGSSPDGTRIAWSSNRRDPQSFDIYIQDLSTFAYYCVFEGKGSYEPVSWHPEKDALLIRRSNTNLDHDLGILDLQTGAVDWFTTHEGDAAFHQPQFNQKGDAVYVLTNKDREFTGLAMIQLDSKEWTWIDERHWDLEKLTINSEKKQLAYTVNAGGISTGVIYSITSNSLTEWHPPQGVIEDLTFSPDGKSVAFVLNGAAYPPDVWEYSLELKTIARVTHISYAPAVESHLVEPELVEYTSFDGRKIPAFYYKPKHVEGPYPVVIFVHGGPESQIRAAYNPFLQYFIHRGYAVCTPNVRGSTGYGKSYEQLDNKRKRMDAVRDLVSLADWLKTEGQADPDRIAIMGRSYGGFMVLAAVTHYPEIWAAGIDIVGISSFKSFLQNTSVWRRKLREAEYGSLEEDLEFFDQIDPIHHTANIQAPLIVLHGANDPRVPVEEAEQIVADLEQRNHPVQYIRFEDEGHFFVKTDNNIKAYTEVANFLDYWLSPIKRDILKR